MKRQEKSERSYSLKERITEASQLPKDVVLGMPLVTLTGRTELTLENYRGIIEYTQELIRIQTKIAQIKVTGRNLTIPYYTNDEMQITGVICSIEYD